MNRKCAHVLAFCLAWVALAEVSMGQNTGRELGAELAVQSPARVGDAPAAATDRLSRAAAKAAPAVKPRDPNEDVYYRNKVELSMEMGVLPINIPFVFDALVGSAYTQNPTHYTLVPLFPSLRWQMGKINGPGILRGNTDLTVTFSVTAIPRGPENIYDAFDLGFRRNFVHRNWKVAPYFETREGAGFINAQEFNENTLSSLPGDAYAQGQNFTFTLMVGFGARYNFNGKYSAEVGGMYMHVSNLYLSEPKWDDNGINVCGPWIGFNMRLSKPKE
jgi:hypothetical protein